MMQANPIHNTSACCGQRNEVKDLYSSVFFEDHKQETLCSAEVIVPLVMEVFPVESVIDIGCGTGTWLSVFRKHGVRKIRGYDGSCLEPDQYFVPSTDLVRNCDFTSPAFRIQEKADLVVSLEVAEHLPQWAAERFVQNLVSAAPAVLFSAAFPGQTGVNHVNEQPPWYWREKFHACGYAELDFLRPAIWSNPEICWWYRQNITMFVQPRYLQALPKASRLYSRYPELNGARKLTVVSEQVLRKHVKESHDSLKTDLWENSSNGPAPRQTSVQELLMNAYRLIQNGTFEEALPLLNAAAFQYPHISHLQYFRAVCLYNLGRIQDARDAILQELLRNPNHPASLEMLKKI